MARRAFSILERIELGETETGSAAAHPRRPFSILERIELGETYRAGVQKLRQRHFQYPRTDRIG